MWPETVGYLAALPESGGHISQRNSGAVTKGGEGWQIKTTEVTIGGSRGGTWVGEAWLESLSCTGHLAGEGKSRTKAFTNLKPGRRVRLSRAPAAEVRPSGRGQTQRQRSDPEAEVKTRREIPAPGKRENRPKGSTLQQW